MSVLVRRGKRLRLEISNGESAITATPDDALVRPEGRHQNTAQTAAQAKGRERYEGFVEALGRRLVRGRTLADELVTDIQATGSGKAAEIERS